MATRTLKAKQHLENAITYMEWLDIDLTMPRGTRKQALKDLVKDIKRLKKNRAWAFEIWLKYVKLGWMLMDEAQPNLGHEARVAKRAYTLIKPVLGRKVPFFPRLKMSYLKDSSYQLLEELSLRLIGSTELTDSVGEDLWNYQPNSEVAQQPHEDQLSLDQVEVLNASCEERGESSLNISLEEVLAAAAVEETAEGDDEIGRVPGS